MRLLIQRVTRASVTIAGQKVSAIDHGLLVLFGAAKGDREESIDWLVNKLLGLRIFSDAEGKMNLSVADVKGSLLVVSQFTLYANCAQGRRPGFTDAAAPDDALGFYNRFIAKARSLHAHVATGEFGADMQVELLNDGPVTLILDAP